MALDPLSIELTRIGEETRTPDIDVVEPLRAGLQTGRAVQGQIMTNEEERKAMEFEQLLQSGEEGMNLALKDAEAQGVDLTGVPDPKLYIRSKEDMATWYSFLAKKLQAKKTGIARGEAFQQIAGGEEVIEGFGKLVQTGDISAAEAGKEAAKISFEKELQDVISGKTRIVSAEAEVPEGAVIFDASFQPSSEDVSERLKSRNLPEVPEDIKTAAESAAQKVGLPADLLIGIAGRESKNFDPASKNPTSSATRLGQLLAKSTGKEMFDKAVTEGLIGKDIKFEDAIVDAEMNLIMTGVLFKDNLEAMGNVRDALLAHRLGVGGAREFIKTGKAIVEGRDETADVEDWIADVLVSSGVAEGAIGQKADGSRDLFSIEGIDKELEFLRTQTKFAGTDAMKTAVDILETRKKGILKERGIKDKKGITGKEQAVANTIELVLALAEGVEPAGFVGGTLKNMLAFFNIDAPTATLNQFSGLLAGQMAKGVGGESGRLTDQDRAFALAAMPNARDSKAIRESKKAILRAIVENIRDAEGGDVAAQKRLRKAVFTSAAKFGGKVMTQEQLRKSWKENPSDGLLEAFLWSNGKEATPENVESLKSLLEGASTAQNIQPAGAILIQGVDDATQIQASTDTTQGGGLGLDLPQFEAGQ